MSHGKEEQCYDVRSRVESKKKLLACALCYLGNRSTKKIVCRARISFEVITSLHPCARSNCCWWLSFIFLALLWPILTTHVVHHIWNPKGNKHKYLHHHHPASFSRTAYFSPFFFPSASFTGYSSDLFFPPLVFTSPSLPSGPSTHITYRMND